MNHIFVSYSRKNISYVEELRCFLEDKGISVWSDKDIEYGANWFDSIVEAIEKCGAFLVIMTPDARKSKFVKKEMHIAEYNNKPMFAFLLEGKPFEYFLDTQFIILEESRRYMPRLSVISTLAKHVSRTPNTNARQAEQIFELPKRETYRPENLLLNITEWSQYFKPGQTDFYGLVMLSLALEELNQHERAVLFLQKAHKLEPRIKEKAWMTNNYGWTERHHKLFEAIITNAEFWDLKLNKK